MFVGFLYPFCCSIFTLLRVLRFNVQMDVNSPSGFRSNNFVASINDLAEARTPEMVSVTELGYRMMRSSTHRACSKLLKWL